MAAPPELDAAAEKVKADAAAAKITTDMLPKINPDDLIVPPPELKSIIEVTVGYVVRNGLSFEGELRKRQQSSRKFDFLIPGNPYYKWYKWKLACAIDPKAAEEAKKLAEKQKEEENEMMQAKETEKEMIKKSVKVVELTLKQKIEQDMKLHKKVREEFKFLVPEPKYYVPLPSHMTNQDVDLIQLTAQFVARNGRTFLNALSSQAQSQGSLSQRYLFLNPIDPRFPYFQKLVTAYNECIVVQPETLNELKGNLELDRLYYEAVGAAEQTVIEERKRKMMDVDSTNVAMEYKLIDWQDFQVVETIQFDEENEYYPAPGKDIEAINNILDMESRKEINVVLADDVESDMEVDMDVDADAESSEEEIVEAPKQTQVREIEDKPAPAAQPKKKKLSAQQSDGTIVTANLDQAIKLESEENRRLRMALEREVQRSADGSGDQYTKCPVTGIMVETRNLSEHIRISLLDPKWKQQKDALLGRMKVSSLAEDSDIVSNLTNFQKKHSANMGFENEQADSTAQTSAPEESRLKEAREAARLRKAAAAGITGGPGAKRRKIGLEKLQPEDQFMKTHRGAETIKVLLESAGAQKTLEYSVPVTTTIQHMKQQVQRSTGMASSAIKLSTDLGELEDQRTLAYYNLASGAELRLSS